MIWNAKFSILLLRVPRGWVRQDLAAVWALDGFIVGGHFFKKHFKGVITPLAFNFDFLLIHWRIPFLSHDSAAGAGLGRTAVTTVPRPTADCICRRPPS